MHGTGRRDPHRSLPSAPQDDRGWAATWEGDLPRHGGALLAVYEETGRSGYPFPCFPDPPLSPPADLGPGVIIDATTPKRETITPSPHGSVGVPVMTHTVQAPVGPDSEVELWAGAPGTLQVLVDDVWVTDDGDADWRVQDPELRDQAWQVYTAGQRRTLPLPDHVMADLRPGETRTAQISVMDATAGAPWQVLVTGAGEPAGTATTLTLGDGATTPLELGCADPEAALLNLSSGYSDAGPVDGRVRVGLSAPATDTPGRVSAWPPVSFEEFDHEAAVPPVEIDFESAAFPQGYQVEQRLTHRRPDRGGQGVPEADRRLHGHPLHDRGVGRIHLTLDDEPVDDQLDDGWWTAWTDDRTTTVALGSLDHLVRPGAVLELRVEDYEPGDVLVEVLAIDP